MQMDAETDIVAPGLGDAGPVLRPGGGSGRPAVGAGVRRQRRSRADEVAYSLGRALQLTNILRDLAEDAARGRLYLPAEWLSEAGVPHDPAQALASPQLPAVCGRVLAEARRRFALAHAAMAQCDPAAMRPARLMGATYSAVLDRLQQRGWTDLDRPAKLPTWQKLWIAARYLR